MIALAAALPDATFILLQPGRCRRLQRKKLQVSFSNCCKFEGYTERF